LSSCFSKNQNKEIIKPASINNQERNRNRTNLTDWRTALCSLLLFLRPSQEPIMEPGKRAGAGLYM
jgi:hypothetical protein